MLDQRVDFFWSFRLMINSYDWIVPFFVLDIFDLLISTHSKAFAILPPRFHYPSSPAWVFRHLWSRRFWPGLGTGHSTIALPLVPIQHRCRHVVPFSPMVKLILQRNESWMCTIPVGHARTLRSSLGERHAIFALGRLLTKNRGLVPKRAANKPRQNHILFGMNELPGSSGAGSRASSEGGTLLRAVCHSLLHVREKASNILDRT